MSTNAAVSEPSLLRRDIGRAGVAAIAMNGVVGSGIFALPAVAVAQAGFFSPWLFAFCGLLILSVALTLARVASFFDRTGGPIVYTTEAFGRFVGFQTGTLIYISRVAAIAASANLIVGYAATLWEPLNDGLVRAFAIVGYIATATGLNCLGVRAGMMAIYAISIMKLAPLLLLVVVGVPEIQWHTAATAPTLPADQFGQTMLVLMYAFIGFEFSLISAGETRDARRTIPFALIRTVTAVAIVYALIQLVVVSVAPDIGTSKTPLVDVARRLLGDWGAILLGVGVVFSIGGGNLTSLLTAPRLTLALSEQGTLPKWLGRIDARSGGPVNSILLCGFLSAVLAVGQQFLWLASFSTFVRLITYALCIASLPLIERKFSAAHGQFRLKGGWTIPAVGFALTLWLLSQSTIDNVIITIGLVAVGSLIFLVSKWSATKSSASAS